MVPECRLGDERFMQRIRRPKSKGTFHSDYNPLSSWVKGGLNTEKKKETNYFIRSKMS